MPTVTSDYKWTEQNGEPHSNLNLVLARCTVYKQLTPDYNERREFAIMMTWKQKYIQHLLCVPGLIFIW